MPELPEVETIRAGLARWVTGRTIASVGVYHPRAVRRHAPGAADFAERLAGRRIAAVSRRGKYLWLPLAEDEFCLVVHLGMSGQLLIHDDDVPDERHLRVRLRLAHEPGDGGVRREVRFVDQRTFGGLLLDRLVPAADAPGERLPSMVAHIGRDPLDPYFDPTRVNRALRRRSSAIKRVLLDQSLVSGIGNIYADEALWRARLHGERPASMLRAARVDTLLVAVRAVLGDALVAGGTSFDSLYVNVNGRSGYFDRELAVYGRAGQACRRCGTAIRRDTFMNRSSFYCPHCQRAPRTTR